MSIPKIPFGLVGEAIIAWITSHLASPISLLAAAITQVNDLVLAILNLLNPFVFIAVLTLLAWRFGGRALAGFVLLGFLAIWDQGLWLITMKTLAMAVTSTVLSVAIGVPIGVGMAESRALSIGMTPILDFLQTMPRFVYLIPAVIILGIDVAPAILATTTLAVIPPARLTALGISQIDYETVEAGTSMGCTRRQLLFKVKLPLALPEIMLGINQSLMMALSMVIIAALIGASGLGDEILMSIAVLDAGRGIVAGLAVLVLAISLDRISKGWVARTTESRGIMSRGAR